MSAQEIADRPTEIDVEARERPYDGFRPVDTYRFRHRVAGDPDWEAPVRRQILRSPPIVAVLPYDPDAGRIVLLKQFRLGAHLATGSGMLVEIVAGGVDEGEESEAAAARELREETGLERAVADADRALSFLSRHLRRVHRASTRRGSTSRRLPQRAGHDEHEIIYPFACTPAEAIAAADSGAISNVFTLLALNWLDRHKESLFAVAIGGRQWTTRAGSCCR